MSLSFSFFGSIVRKFSVYVFFKGHGHAPEFLVRISRVVKVVWSVSNKLVRGIGVDKLSPLNGSDVVEVVESVEGVVGGEVVVISVGSKVVVEVVVEVAMVVMVVVEVVVEVVVCKVVNSVSLNSSNNSVFLLPNKSSTMPSISFLERIS